MVLKIDICLALHKKVITLPLTASIYKIKTKQKNMSGIHVCGVASD